MALVLLGALIRVASAVAAAVLGALAVVIFLTAFKAGSALVVVAALVLAAAAVAVAGRRLARRLELDERGPADPGRE